MARGGGLMHGTGGPHGSGGPGMHSGVGAGERDSGQGMPRLTPAYVLISVLKVTDAEPFKTMMGNLQAGLALSPADWSPTRTSRSPGTALRLSTSS